jgi:hypothetical protein
MDEGQLEKTPGDLLATARFPRFRYTGPWFWEGRGDDALALLIFERCLVSSGGRSREASRRLFQAFFNPLKFELVTHSFSRWYDEQVAADANRDLSELVAADPGNWIVWSTDVVKWDLRAGIQTSRLRLELVDGTRRKVLWNRKTPWVRFLSNSLPPIRAALHRALDAPAHR